MHVGAPSVWTRRKISVHVFLWLIARKQSRPPLCSAAVGKTVPPRLPCSSRAALPPVFLVEPGAQNDLSNLPALEWMLQAQHICLPCRDVMVNEGRDWHRAQLFASPFRYLPFTAYPFDNPDGATFSSRNPTKASACIEAESVAMSVKPFMCRFLGGDLTRLRVCSSVIHSGGRQFLLARRSTSQVSPSSGYDMFNTKGYWVCCCCRFHVETDLFISCANAVMKFCERYFTSALVRALSGTALLIPIGLLRYPGRPFELFRRPSTAVDTTVRTFVGCCLLYLVRRKVWTGIIW